MGYVDTACRSCGEPLRFARRDKRYCSVRCRVAAFRQRRRQTDPEPPTTAELTLAPILSPEPVLDEIDRWFLGPIVLAD